MVRQIDSGREILVAVARKPGTPFSIERAILEPPRPDEVLVRIVASGICHTDIVVRDQYYPVPQPAVLGHEGAGVVEEVGANVVGVKPGEPVVLSYQSCGHCRTCLTGHPNYCGNFYALNFGGSRLDGSTAMKTPDGEVLHAHFFGQSSFGSYAVCHYRNIVKVPEDAPLELLGPLACGVQTGAGAVLRALRVPAGASIAIFGVGAVGLSAVMAAKIAGATKIIAVDISSSRLEMAASLGATHVVNSTAGDVLAEIRKITRDGVDFTIECSGRPSVLRHAIDALANQGTCGVVGAPKMGAEVNVDVNMLMVPGKRIQGIVQGDAVPQIFIPELIEMHRQGLFPFDRFCRLYEFSDINKAIEDSESGSTIKPILKF